MDMIELHDAIYCMYLSGGGDVWCLHGKVVNHPRFSYMDTIYPSTPVEFDETTDVFKTRSGNTYKIVSYGTDRNKVVDQLKKDIAAGGYEVH